MKTYSGYTADTTEHLILDAGAFFKNYDPSADTPDTATAKLLGATRGGGEFRAIPTVRKIEVDGVKGDAKGLKTLDSWQVGITANMLELDVDVLKTALVAGDVDTATDLEYDILTARNNIELTDYVENITWIGTLSGSDKPVIIQVFNALSGNGLTLNSQDASESVVSLEFTGHYDGSDLQSPPFKIFYPKMSATV